MTRVTSADEGGAKLNRWSGATTFYEWDSPDTLSAAYLTAPALQGTALKAVTGPAPLRPRADELLCDLRRI